MNMYKRNYSKYYKSLCSKYIFANRKLEKTRIIVKSKIIC